MISEPMTEIKKMTLNVNVTDQKIVAGARRTCCSCPIALAINTPKMIFPEIQDASVHLRDGHFTRRENMDSPRMVHRFELPESAQAFVLEYQAGKTPRPFKFELTAKVSHQHNGGNSTL